MSDIPPAVDTSAAPRQFKPKRWLGVLLGVLGVLISWVGFMLFPFTLALSIPLYVWTGRHSRWALALSLICSSYCALPFWGIFNPLTGYWGGTATFVAGDYCPPATFGDYDQRDGAYIDQKGSDIYWPIDRLYDVPNNVLLAALCHRLGPEPHSYQGPLPSWQDAQQALSQGGSMVPAGDFHGPVLNLASGQANLTASARAMCLKKTIQYLPGPAVEYEYDTAQPINAVLYQGQCLVVLTPATGSGQILTLIDASTGRVIDQEASGKQYSSSR